MRSLLGLSSAAGGLYAKKFKETKEKQPDVIKREPLKAEVSNVSEVKRKPMKFKF